MVWLGMNDGCAAPVRYLPAMTGPSHARERFAFASLVLLTLAPVVVQGMWRALTQAVPVEIDAYPLTCATLPVAAAVLLAGGARPANRWLPYVSGAGVALALGLRLGEGRPAVVVLTTSLLAVAAGCAALLPWLVQRLPRELDGLAARRKGVATLLLLFGFATVGGTTRLSVFMGDPARAEYSLAPDLPFFLHHSCLTAYVEAADLVGRGVENVYDIARWPDLNGTPRSESFTGPYAPFTLDAFAYPPPFLLIPRILLSWLGDFGAQRAVWYTVNGLLVAAGLGTVASWLGGRAGLRALLLAPVVWMSIPTQGTLQAGNVHLAVMVAAMLALVAFETRRPALGGALLAVAILTKISPGLLLLVLLVRGRFREILWTVGFALVFSGVGVLCFGPAPFVAFVSYELPRLSSGEALTFLAGPDSVPINLAPFGIPFKLAALGVDVGDPWVAARRISGVFSALLVGVALVAARGPRDRGAMAGMWAALLTLASLRSPLAPGYVTFALLWLLCVRADEVRGPRQALVVAGIWVFLTVPLRGSPTSVVLYTMVQQVVIVGVAVAGLSPRPPRETPTLAAGAAA